MEVLAKEAIGDLGDEVEALHGGEAGDDAEDRGGVGDLLATKGVQQVAAALDLPGEVLGGVVGGDVVVGGRVPLGVVDAIEDAVEVGGALAEDIVEAVAEFGSLDLLGVFAADGGEGVGVDDASLEEVEGVVVLERPW